MSRMDPRALPGLTLVGRPATKEGQAAAGVSLRAVPAVELIRFHAAFARQLAGLPAGSRFVVKLVE
jgi:hypothetical protein